MEVYMKRFWMIALVLGLIAGFGLATAFSAVQAQSDAPQTPWGQGMRGRHGGGMMGGMMGSQQTGETGPMHTYMQAALADKLGLTPEALQTLHDEGQTFWQIAEDQGVSADDAQQMMLDARATALDQMVADGAITADQAELMKTRMGGRMSGQMSGQMRGRMGGMHGAGGCH
jgi:hypothetical protein